ncbi:MAG: hypothetical protein IJZ03_08055 [Clostridia bacterium]|nr:hypothetical protein [Clostridia bacterium]
MSGLYGRALRARLKRRLEKTDPFSYATLISYGGISRKERSYRLYSVIRDILLSSKFDISAEDLSVLLVNEAKKRPFSDKESVRVLPMIGDVVSRRIACVRDINESDFRTLLERVRRLVRSFEIFEVESLRSEISAIDRALFECGYSEYFASEDLSRAMIRTSISNFAKKHRISEKDASVIYCREQGFSDDKKRRKGLTFIYFSLITVFSILLSFAFTCITFSNPIIFFLLLFPISETVKFLTDRAFSHLIRPSSPPRLKIDSIPDRAKTLTVITSLISDKDEGIFRQIEEFYLSNRDKNAYFGLLLDLPESVSPSDRRDADIISFVNKKYSELNEKYPGRFSVFIRDRVKSVSENKYMGYERKRGALIDLTLFLRNDTSRGFILCETGDMDICDIKYVITLDRDTRLYAGAVRDMVSAMLHSANRPTLKNGRVVSGYAIMQPHTATSLASFGKTYFSFFTSRAGVDPYQSASFDLYQSLFGEGIFCGKGIFDVDVYKELIPDAFSDGTVLSHDLLEGSRLRCGVLSDVTLTDSHPATPSSFFKRLHRWIRGDIQSTVYAAARINDRYGRRIKNPISALSRFFIYDNVRRAIVPIASCAVLLLTLAFSYSQSLLTFLALSYIIIPPIFRAISSLKGATRKFFSHVIPSIGNALWDLLFGVSSVFAYALVSLDALFKGFVRSRITRRKTLEWSVSSFDSRGGFFSQISWSVLSYTVGLFILVFASGWLMRGAAILWISLPLIFFALSLPLPRTRKATGAEKAELLRWAFDSWSFFDTYVSEKDNYLPPDNVQEFPSVKIAHRTSPTNIGMYLVSLLAACDCGFIDSYSLYRRLERTLSTLEELPKKHGHLYNWYDTEKLSVLGEPYVSTVDSGNFAVCVVALCEGLKEYEKKEPDLKKIRIRYEKLAKAADFSFLYSKRRKLFYIGVDASGEFNEESCYDLYMSEARTTGYYAIAKGDVSAKHWRHLGRPVIGSRGYIGVASWSGSMFEYFMPHLFLPSYDGSLAGEALAFAANAQMENRINGFWGVSESAYFHFDSSMNYQYKANGVSALALDPIIGKDKVISPYSSFLCMGVARRAAIKNLEKLKKHGAYGRHGFYESIDFTRSRVGNSDEKIRMYMSHHVGMSIVSVANACYDGIFVKRFMNDPQMSSVRELLCESIPTEASIDKKSALHIDVPMLIGQSKKFLTQKSRIEKGSVPSVCILSDDSSFLAASDAGHLFLSHKDIAISGYPFDQRDMYDISNGLRIFYRTEKGVNSVLPEIMSYSGARIIYKSGKPEFSDGIYSSLGITLMRDEGVFCFKLETVGDFKEFSPMITFEVLLSRLEDRISHPFYAALSIEAIYEKEDSILCFKSRPREGKTEKWIGISLENYPEDFEFDTRYDLLPLNYTDEDIKDLFDRELPSRTGACISPYCFVKGKNISCAGKASCEFLIAYADSYEEINRKIFIARKRSGKDISSFFASTLHSLAQSRLARVSIAPPYLKYADLYLSALYFHLNENVAQDFTHSRNELWAKGISGDLPIVGVVLPEEISASCKRICDTLIRLHRLTRIRGKKSDLVFTVKESDGYSSQNKNILYDIVQACDSSELISRHGGVFIISEDNSFSEFLSSVSALYIEPQRDSSVEEIFHSIKRRTLRAPKDEIKISNSNYKVSEPDAFLENELCVYGGVFGEDGFSLDKSRISLVWSYIYSGRVFGTLMTQNSLGYTWFANSKEKRLTPYFSSFRRDICGERIIAVFKDPERYDIVASSHSCRFEKGCAVYESSIRGIDFTVRVGVDAKLPVKLASVEVRGSSEMLESVVYTVDPVIGENVCPPNLIVKKKDGTTEFFRRRYDSHLSEHTVFLISNGEETITEDSMNVRCFSFVFGIFPSFSDRAYYHIKERFSCARDINAAFDHYRAYYENIISRISLLSSDRLLDTAINYYIPYQVMSARLFGRSGFYQSSGAYGFRDQLQDSLAMLYYEPAFCKYQILRAAAHQYTEGDVQHWWHNSLDQAREKWHAGLRSRCSDDLLWLPYAVSEYIKATEDRSILDLKVRYIESDELDKNEQTRYERPIRSKYRESIYCHCILAIERSLRFGKNSLPLIGSCDWNDGFDRVGDGGKGESVWLAQFQSMVLSDFAEICKKKGDEGGYKKYRDISNELTCAIEKNAYVKDRYLRGFYDDGRPLGAPESSECEIDLLTQSFACLSSCDRKRATKAMELACSKLWDRDARIVKLFTPAFSGYGEDPGYIRGYCSGFRENGGQYTHASLWAVWALFSIGKNTDAYEMLCDINPIVRSRDKRIAKKYKTEPYALCGDVYSNPEHNGRGGWSLYTGSASWFVRVTLSELIGFKKMGEGRFIMDPHLSESFSRFTLALRGKENICTVKASLAEKEASAETSVDGRSVENQKNFSSDSKLIEITVENNSGI